MWIQQLSQYVHVIETMERLRAINRNTKLLKIYQTLKKAFTSNLELTLMQTIISQLQREVE